MKKFVLVALLTLSGIANAQIHQFQKCLQMASDVDLLNEVGRRMSMSTKPPVEPLEQFDNVIACKGNELKIISTNLENGTSQETKYRFDFESECSSAAKLLQTQNDSTLPENKMVGACKGNTLVTFLIKKNSKAISYVKETAFDFESECEAAAKQVNN